MGGRAKGCGELSLFTALWPLGAFSQYSEEETPLWPNGFLQPEHNKHYAAIKQCGCCGLRTANFNFTCFIPPCLPLSTLSLHPIPARRKHSRRKRKRRNTTLLDAEMTAANKRVGGYYHHAARFVGCSYKDGRGVSTSCQRSHKTGKLIVKHEPGRPAQGRLPCQSWHFISLCSIRQ